MSLLPASRPGTAAWLIRHEIRLFWRGVVGKRVWPLVVALVLLTAGEHYGAWRLEQALPDGAWPPVATWILGGATWLLMSLMLSQTILMSVTALFDRGDLDLLLSSPLPTRTVFLARALGIAFNAGVLYLFLLAPFANVGPFVGHPAFLAIYPTLVALALGTTALGMGLTLALVRLLGARRARAAAQVLGTLVGAAMFLATQAPNVLGPAVTQALTAALVRWSAPGGALAPDGIAWLAARALRGEPGALALTLALGVAVFWSVVQLTQRRFLAGTQESVGGSARGGAAPAVGSTRFRAGLWRNVLAKEWRLILRDPQLIAQTLMQVVYLLPATFIVLRSKSSALPLIAPAIVFLASQLASNIAWITMAAEEAPELLAGSPSSMARIRVIKLAAALLPVWVLVAPMLVFVATKSALLAAIFLVCLAGGTGSAGAAQVWYPRRGKRTDMKRRAQGHMALTLVELVVIIGWAATAWCLGARPSWAPLPLAAALLGLGLVWWMGRSRRAEEANG